MAKAFRAMWDGLLETLFIVKVCLTSFWFWLPILYGGYIVLQIWLLVAVHPLTIVILPAIIAAYLVVTREKRMRIQYGIDDEEHKKRLSPYSLTTREQSNSSWDVERALEEYEKMTKDKEEDRS